MTDHGASAQGSPQHLRQMFRTVRSVHAVLAAEDDICRVADGICSVLVNNPSYYSTWIALLDADGAVSCFAGSGIGPGFEKMKKMLERGEFTLCLKKVLDCPGPIFIGNPAEECSDCPLFENCEGHAGLTSRLFHGGRLYGVMSSSVSADLTGSMEDLELYGELCSDIAVGISRLKLQEAEREAAEEKDRVLNRISDAMISLSPEMVIGQLMEGVKSSFLLCLRQES